MRTAILTIAAMMANLIGGMANAQYDPDPNPTCGIWIYDNKFGWTLATNPARMARSLTGPRPDPRKAQEEKLKVEAVQAAAVETHTPEERVRINERMQATAAAVPKANTNSPPAIKIVSSEKSD